MNALWDGGTSSSCSGHVRNPGAHSELPATTVNALDDYLTLHIKRQCEGSKSPDHIAVTA